MGYNRKLELNHNKTEALWVGGSQVWELGCLPVLDGVALPLKEQVHSLGVLLDSSFVTGDPGGLERPLSTLVGTPATPVPGQG